MQVSLDTNFGHYQIKKYHDEGFTLLVPPQLSSDTTTSRLELNQPIILGLDFYQLWDIRDFSELSKEHLSGLLDAQPEVVLLGCGQATRFPAQESLEQFYRLGIGVELMSTAAACRTYNILAAEGRKVIAAMLLHSS